MSIGEDYVTKLYDVRENARSMEEKMWESIGHLLKAVGEGRRSEIQEAV